MVAGQLRSSVTITECLPSIRVLKIADLTNNAHRGIVVNRSYPCPAEEKCSMNTV